MSITSQGRRRTDMTSREFGTKFIRHGDRDLCTSRLSIFTDTSSCQSRVKADRRTDEHVCTEFCTKFIRHGDLATGICAPPGYQYSLTRLHVNHESKQTVEQMNMSARNSVQNLFVMATWRPGFVHLQAISIHWHVFMSITSPSRPSNRWICLYGILYTIYSSWRPGDRDLCISRPSVFTDTSSCQSRVQADHRTDKYVCKEFCTKSIRHGDLATGICAPPGYQYSLTRLHVNHESKQTVEQMNMSARNSVTSSVCWRQ